MMLSAELSIGLRILGEVEIVFTGGVSQGENLLFFGNIDMGANGEN